MMDIYGCKGITILQSSVKMMKSGKQLKVKAMQRSRINIQPFRDSQLELRMSHRLSVHSSRNHLIESNQSNPTSIKKRCWKIDSVLLKQNTMKCSRTRDSLLSDSKNISISIVESLRSPGKCNDWSSRTLFVSPRPRSDKKGITHREEVSEDIKGWYQDFKSTDLKQLSTKSNKLSKIILGLKQNRKDYRGFQELMAGVRMVQGTYRQLKIKIEQIEQYIGDIIQIPQREKIKKCRCLKQHIVELQNQKEMITKECSKLLTHKCILQLLQLITKQINELNVIITLFSGGQRALGEREQKPPRRSVELFHVEKTYKSPRFRM